MGANGNSALTANARRPRKLASINCPILIPNTRTTMFILVLPLVFLLRRLPLLRPVPNGILPLLVIKIPYLPNLIPYLIRYLTMTPLTTLPSLARGVPQLPLESCFLRLSSLLQGRSRRSLAAIFAMASCLTLSTITALPRLV